MYSVFLCSKMLLPPHSNRLCLIFFSIPPTSANRDDRNANVICLPFWHKAKREKCFNAAEKGKIVARRVSNKSARNSS
jgi:hypothetical protein